MPPIQPPKRRTIDEPPSQSRWVLSTPVEKKARVATTVPRGDTSSTSTARLNTSIQQARDFAVAQAQQDGVLGNFKIFDSLYNNFLVPVLPTQKKQKRHHMFYQESNKERGSSLSFLANTAHKFSPNLSCFVSKTGL